MTEEFQSAEGQSPEEEIPNRPNRERYKVAGEKLLSKMKELIQEGNIRRITIRNEEDKVLIEIPLTIGVVGAALFPVWAAVGAIAALVTSCSIEVERAAPEEEGD
jgi:DNA-binding Lrp family transcriptional regulator